MWIYHHAIRDVSSARPADLETKGHSGHREQLERRATLQALARHGCWLTRELLSDGARWAVFAEAGQGARLVRQVADSLARQLQREKLVEPVEDGAVLRWRLSQAGRQWLRRHAPAMATAPRPDMMPAGQKCDTPQRAAGSRGRKATRGNGDKGRQANAQREVQRLLVRDAESGALHEVAVNVRENPLMWLARRKDASGRPYLEPHHVAAGERLRQDYETACMQPQITASWNPALVAADRGRLKSGPRDPFPFAERVMAARQRVRQALEDIGAELADIAVSVCCLGNGIEAAERALNWPRRSARLVLRIALERLADHYGLQPARAPATPGWQHVLRWHAEDGRPSELMPDEANHDQEQATTRRNE